MRDRQRERNRERIILRVQRKTDIEVEEDVMSLINSSVLNSREGERKIDKEGEIEKNIIIRLDGERQRVI